VKSIALEEELVGKHLGFTLNDRAGSDISAQMAVVELPMPSKSASVADLVGKGKSLLVRSKAVQIETDRVADQNSMEAAALRLRLVTRTKSLDHPARKPQHRVSEVEGPTETRRDQNAIEVGRV